jgi:hypothetical protein
MSQEKLPQQDQTNLRKIASLAILILVFWGGSTSMYNLGNHLSKEARLKKEKEVQKIGDQVSNHIRNIGAEVLFLPNYPLSDGTISNDQVTKLQQYLSGITVDGKALFPCDKVGRPYGPLTYEAHRTALQILVNDPIFKNIQTSDIIRDGSLAKIMDEQYFTESLKSKLGLNNGTINNVTSGDFIKNGKYAIYKDLIPDHGVNFVKGVGAYTTKVLNDTLTPKSGPVPDLK